MNEDAGLFVNCLQLSFAGKNRIKPVNSPSSGLLIAHCLSCALGW